MMKKAFSLYIAIIAVAFLAGCGKHELPKELKAADSLMDSRPDSALALLNSVSDAMKDQPKAIRMRFQMLRHKAMNKAFVPFTSDSAMLIVTDYYKNHGTANDRMQANYLLGCVYRDLDQVPHAIDCFHDAATQADTTSKNCDYTTLSCTYSQMAWLYYKQLLIENEIQARRKSANWALKANDTLNFLYEQGMIAGSYILLNKKDSAEMILRETMHQYQIHGYKQEALTVSLTLMYLYVDDPHRQSEQKTLIDDFEMGSELFDARHELPPSKRQYYYYKGKFYEGINCLDSAEYYYRKVYRPKMSFTSQTVMYKGLLSIYTKLGRSDSIAKYSKLYCMATDSSVIIKDQQQTVQLAASYDYHYFRNLSLANENKVLWISIVLIIIFNISILIIIILVWLYRRYKIMQEKRIEKMSAAYKQAETRHRQEANQLKIKIAEVTELYRQKQDALLQLEKKHNATLAKAQSDLEKAMAEKQASQSFLLKAQQDIEEQKRQYSQTKVNLLEEISVLKKQISQMTLSQQQALSQDLSETPIIVMLKSMKEPYRVLTLSEQKALRTAFSNTYPALIYDINKKAKLNLQDITICLLTILGFEPGRICNMTDRSSSSVTNVRAKINERLFNEKSSPKLYSNLINNYSIYPI